MAKTLKVQVQDEAGNIYYLHTSADIVFCEDGKSVEEKLQTGATQSVMGMLSAADKKKLDGVEEGANKYTHPADHPAAMITQDSTHRFATDAEKTRWNGVESGLVYRKKLTASDDLDTLLQNGLYYYYTGDVPENAPFENAAIVEVFGSTSETSQKIQRVTRYGAKGQMAVRPLHSPKDAADVWSYAYCSANAVGLTAVEQEAIAATKTLMSNSQVNSTGKIPTSALVYSMNQTLSRLNSKFASDLTKNRAVISNSAGKIAVSAVTATELGYLDGASSNIQEQIDSLVITEKRQGVQLTDNWCVITERKGYVLAQAMTIRDDALLWCDGVNSRTDGGYTLFINGVTNKQVALHLVWLKVV